MATIYTAVSFFNGDTHCIVTIGFSEPSVTRSQFSPISTASPFKSVKILVLINCATDFGSHASFSFSLYLSLSLFAYVSVSPSLSTSVPNCACRTECSQQTHQVHLNVSNVWLSQSLMDGSGIFCATRIAYHSVNTNQMDITSRSH